MCLIVSYSVHLLRLKSSLSPISNLLHLTTILLLHEQDLKLAEKTSEVDRVKVETMIVVEVKDLFDAKRRGPRISIAISVEIGYISLKR